MVHLDIGNLCFIKRVNIVAYAMCSADSQTNMFIFISGP